MGYYFNDFDLQLLSNIAEAIKTLNFNKMFVDILSMFCDYIEVTSKIYFCYYLYFYN